MPARLSVRQTVACGCPVSPAISRGPQPERRLAAQIRSCSTAGSSRGIRCGRDERSSRQASERRCSTVASDQRRHHLQAVVGETPRRLAAPRHDRPASTSATSARGQRVRDERYGEAPSGSLLRL